MSKKTIEKPTYYRDGNLIKLPSNNRFQINKIMQEYGEYLDGVCAEARKEIERAREILQKTEEPGLKEEDSNESKIIKLKKECKSYIKRAILNILCLLYFSLMDKNFFIIKSMLIGYCSALVVKKIFNIYECTTEIHNIKTNNTNEMVNQEDKSMDPALLYKTELAIENHRGARTYTSLELNEDNRGPRLVLKIKNPYDLHH